MGSDFAKQLEAHHRDLIEQIARVEEEIASRTQHLRQLQLKLESVLELMKMEGIAPPQAHRHFIEVAHDLLLESGPRHYTELANVLRTQGVLIPGTKPEANLLAHMSRDPRFAKVGRGTYAVLTGKAEQKSSERTKVGRASTSKTSNKAHRRRPEGD